MPRHYPVVRTTRRRPLAVMYEMRRYSLPFIGFGSFGSTTWNTANRAIFWPVCLEQSMTIAVVAWLNGTAANTGNIDAGLYTLDGTRLFSTGSTAQAGGTSVIQTVTLGTPARVGRGWYYAAMACSATGTSIYMFNVSSTQSLYGDGSLLQDSAFPLPVTATFAQNTAFSQVSSLSFHTGTPL